MIEQWEADRLLAMPKIYTDATTIGLGAGANDFYILDSNNETETFLLDVWRGHRNHMKARFQLRYQRNVILARLCTAVPH
jgi:hypothetical protein